MNTPHTDLQRAVHALHTIPANCDRDTWVKVGMACKDVGVSFDTFDQWSAQGDTYRPKDCLSAWKSFKEGKGVGAGTLFSIAKRHGWSEGHQPPAPPKRPYQAPATTPPEPRTYAAGMSPDEVWSRCKPAPNTPFAPCPKTPTTPQKKTPTLIPTATPPACLPFMSDAQAVGARARLLN